MPPFRRVESKQAGPTALGILVPPGGRTLVVLRPRDLPWDLLPARWEGGDVPPTFCTFERDEAAAVARRVHKALEQAVANGVNPLQTLEDPRGETFQVWARTDEFVWVVCHRAPGQAYRPALFPDRAEARRHADQLAAVLWPAADGGQEYYFNTQHFTAAEA